MSGLCALREYVDDVPWANLGTLAARLALIVIDNCVIVFNVDSVERAFLFAKLAAYASAFANILCCLALIAGRAADNNSGLEGNDLDKLLRACSCADAASDTDVSVYFCNAFADLDCTVRASLFAVAETDASEFAFARASEEAFHCCAGLESLVFHFCFCYVNNS